MQNGIKQVCYYAIPKPSSRNTTTSSKLQPEDLDPFLCTHLIVAFAEIADSEIKPQYEEDLIVYGKVLNLKKINPELKVLLSLGGGTGDAGFLDLVMNKDAIERFGVAAREFLLKYGFDGLDLDWEFPGWPNPLNYKEKSQFTYLVKRLDFFLRQQSSQKLLLTIAVGAPKTIVDMAYEISKIANHVDFVSIMGYDYHIYATYLPITGHNAPLKKRNGEVGIFATLNIEWSANYWNQKGMPKEKIVIGIPTYGRTWRLFTKKWHGVGSVAVGEGFGKGAISYPSALKFIASGATQVYDKESESPYAYLKRDWISYEDEKSIAAKAQWIKINNYAGVMTWSLNNDDWSGTATGEIFKLHNVIKDIIL